MEKELMLGGFALSVLITLVLRIAFLFVPEDKDIPNRIKTLIAVLTGIVLSLAYMSGSGIPFQVVPIINYFAQGAMAGFAAAGMYDATRKKEVV